MQARINGRAGGTDARHSASTLPFDPSGSIRLVLVGSAVLPQTATHLAAYTKEQLLKRGIELETAPRLR